MKKNKSSARVVFPESRKTAPKDAKLSGKISSDERLEVTIRFRRKPGAGTPRVEGKPLTREEFREAYGADPEWGSKNSRCATFGALQPAVKIVVNPHCLTTACFTLDPTPHPSFGCEKIIPCLHCHTRCHLGRSWSISGLQLFTAAKLEPSRWGPSFCTKPRLSDDRSIVITRAAVESHRLSSAARCLYAVGYRLLL
jgi:hypothetical protein